ncbi:MAG: RagB/SusD family nutrient uptake outer membrane protein [Prevotellaceae bacterium]|jgi:hypothetical protein|nr:RagB/SusD family nutrient uptake outer membrane protein [Prevotellaceae bacterium]
MKSILKILTFVSIIVLLFASSLTFHSCLGDLDVIPQDSSIITDEIFKQNPGAYKQNLGKLYAGLAVTGPIDAGSSDIQGLDAGYSQYMRVYWMMQEGSTDEVVLHWGDAGVPELGTDTWTVSNQFIRAMYLRIAYQARVTSEYLKMTSDSKLDDRGQSNMIPEVKTYRAEARWLRAFSYFNAIDLFGKFGFIDENVPLGESTKEKSRKELFDYVESELLAMIPDLKDARANEYGRVDKAAAWFLLAKLYLNAQVWTGTDRSADCITMCNNIIGAGYVLGSNYSYLFLADNNKNSSASEYIALIPQDGLHLQAYGGMTFIIQAAKLSKMNVEMGVGGWNGATTRQELYNKFESNDTRAMFYGDPYTVDIPELVPLDERREYGLGVTKFKNVTSTGVVGSHVDFVDTDYPLMRLADVYLMYAEAAVRSNGDKAKAADYVNELRNRAGVSTRSASDLTLDFILDERARELYWEGWRRQDLIRFSKFTGDDYKWQWKGNVHDGAAIADFRKLFPLPQDLLDMNKNLTQNEGYK